MRRHSEGHICVKVSYTARTGCQNEYPSHQTIPEQFYIQVRPRQTAQNQED